MHQVSKAKPKLPSQTCWIMWAHKWGLKIDGNWDKYFSEAESTSITFLMDLV